MVRTQAKTLVLVTLATIVGQLASGAFWLPGTQMHMIWAPGAILMCALAFTPHRQWLACVLGALIGTAMALALFGVSMLKLMLFIAADYALVALTTHVLLRYGRAQLRLDGFGEMARFVLLAGVLLPAFGTWLMLSAFGRGPMIGWAALWLNIAIAHCLAYLLIVPSVTNLVWAARDPVRRRARGWRELGMTAALALATWYAWYADWDNPVAARLVVLVPIPLLVWSLIAFGLAGACIALLLIALMSMWMSLMGSGPFASMTPADMVFCVQAWALLLTVPMLFLGAFAEQRFTAGVKLATAYRNLTEVTGRMLAVQEEERTRIARDLHDGINQSLAAISIELSALKRASTPANEPAVIALQEQVLAVSNDIRDLSHELHPSVLRFTGLAGALYSFCEKHNGKGSFRIDCDIGDVSFLTDQQELGIFRIVQESVTNIERHARATNAHLALKASASEVRLVIDDDGIGAGADSVYAHKGLGMISMRERARLLGGKFSIHPSPAGGTRVEVWFPRTVPTQT